MSGSRPAEGLRSASGALVLEGFASRLSFGMLSFALPLYAHHLGLSIRDIGLLLSFSMAVSLVAKPVLGPLADRWGLRRTLVGALLVRSLLCLCYLTAVVPWQLFAVRGAHGLSDGARGPAVHALLAEHARPSSVATTFAWYQTAKTAAGAVGKSAAGLVIATSGGFAATFGVAFGLSLLPVVAVLLLVPRTSGPVRAPRPPRPRRGARPAAAAVDRAPGARVRLLPFAGLGFLVAGTSSMLGSMLPLVATEYAGLTTAQAGLLYLATPVLALTGPLWGRLSDRVSRPLVLGLRGVANIASALVMLLLPSLAGMWVGKSLDDLGKAAFRPAWGSLMAELAGRDRATRARTMGVLGAGEDAGDLAAPALAGLVWSVWGIPAVLVLRIAAAVLTEVYVVGLERRHVRAPAPVPSGATPDRAGTQLSGSRPGAGGAPP